MAKTKDTKKPAPVDASEPTPAVEAPPAYTVVARRYRPQQFTDLIGQEHVAQALTNAISSGRIAHAYLFTGARGTGKTSTARILAKALNCVNGPTPTPCDVCDFCKNIATGDDVDAVEIDGASNNGVEAARELRSNVGFRPTNARFKIYIIDEVHMLSTAAFNALLKTIEEPPPHVKFILATTEIHKVPITILSRCQRFDFVNVGPVKIFETLKHICKKEGIQADDDALQIVARRANGSLRDSQTLLDQLLSACEGSLSAAKIHQLLGTASDDRILELAEAILSGDTAKGLQIANESADRGLQLGELVDQMVDYWRGMMLVSVAGKEIDPLLGSTALRERMAEHAKSRSLDAILAGLDILAATKFKMKGSTYPLVLVEMAVVRLSRLEELLPVGDLAQWLQTGAKAPESGAKSPAKTAVPAESSKKKPLMGQEVKSNVGVVEEKANWSVQWEQVLSQLGPFLAEQIRNLPNLPAIVGPNALAISIPASYTSISEQLKSERSTTAIRQGLLKVTGQDWTLRFDEVAAPKPVVGSNAPSTPNAAPISRRQEILNLPFLKSAGDLLGAQLMKLDDGFDPFAAPVVAIAALPEIDDPDAPLPATPLEADES